MSVVALGIALEGCALFPLAAMGAAALNTGGRAITKGTEYTAGGTASRTFSNPIDDVHRAVLETFARTGIRIERDDASDDDARRIVGKAEHRTMRIVLTPLTPTLTSMKLAVKRNILLKDRATATELMAQTKRALVDTRTVAETKCCAVECAGEDARSADVRQPHAVRRHGPRPARRVSRRPAEDPP